MRSGREFRVRYSHTTKMFRQDYHFVRTVYFLSHSATVTLQSSKSFDVVQFNMQIPQRPPFLQADNQSFPHPSRKYERTTVGE
jgi:hypothetical protein